MLIKSVSLFKQLHSELTRYIKQTWEVRRRGIYKCMVVGWLTEGGGGDVVEFGVEHKRKPWT